MKRLFGKNKRSDSQNTPPSSSTPPRDAHTPPSRTGASPALAQPPQQQQWQQPQQQQAYGPPGQQYVLVPVPVQALQQGGGFAQGRGGGGVPRPPRVQDVGNAIGWSVAMPSFDWTYVLALGDRLSANQGASKDAMKALIKEFKERAVRLTGLLWSNTNDKFKEQIASKKFLTAITDLVASPSTPPQVKAMVYRVLSPLAFDSQSNPTLRPITETFNRLLSDPNTSLQSFPHELDVSLPAFQPNGAPLAPDDPLLRPEALLSGSSRRSRPQMERFPTGIEQMRDLRRRAVEGRGWAGMLSEAVALAGDEPAPRDVGRGKKWEEMNSEEKEAAQARGEGPDGIVAEGQEVEVREGLEANEVVQEFHSRCLEAQEFLSTNLDWASVQAEQSRTKADAEPAPAPAPAPAAPQGEQPHLASNNPFAAVVAGGEVPGRRSGATEEEEILSEMLGAMTEISDALHLYALRLSHSRQSAQEDAELAAALDRSRADNRFDRFAPEWDRSRDYGEGGSGAPSRDPFADADEPQREPKGKGKARESLNPYANYLGAPAEQHAGSTADAPAASTASPYDGLEALEGLGGLSLSSPPAASQSQQYQQQHGAFGQQQPLGSGGFSSSNPYASLSSAPAANSNGGYTVPDGADSYPRELAPPLGTTESTFLREYVPVQPSAKALGKLRRVSVGGDDQSPEDRQHQLEDALREKYERNYQEEQERRERDGA
ncbi:hypothetical protein JCM10450v2_007348 [Rhodotorula kratochvilovae]